MLAKRCLVLAEREFVVSVGKEKLGDLVLAKRRCLVLAERVCGRCW